MRRCAVSLIILATLLATFPAYAQEKLKAVASFSILADLVRNVGGDRVQVRSLVGPNGDAHVYTPSPADARQVAEADILFVNGLGFEGWLDRLVQASGSKAPVIVATKQIKPLERKRASGHHHEHEHGAVDPHAWQSVANAMVYVANIRDALVAIDPAGKDVYVANAANYLNRLQALETDIRQTVAKIPADRRSVITTHRAFAYFQDAYGVRFSAPQGVSANSEASAKDVAAIIREIRQNKASGVFFENVNDPRMIQRIAAESGARVGGMLYSDALTDEPGAAASYIELMRHNLKQLATTLIK